jgi:hypothetical protein
MTAAVAIDLEELTPAELYRAEKARRAARVRPEMIEAKAELQRQNDLAIEQRKGGRPRKSAFIALGKKGPRGTRVDEPDAPGRPEWLTPPTPPKEPDLLPAPARRHPSPSTPMATTKTFAPRNCLLDSCRTEFIPSGSTHRFCCVEHRDEYNDAKKPTKKAKAEKPEKKRKRIDTGRPSPRSTRSASGIDLSGAIAKIEEQVAALDAQRERLLGAIESLRELEAA